MMPTLIYFFPVNRNNLYRSCVSPVGITTSNGYHMPFLRFDRVVFFQYGQKCHSLLECYFEFFRYIVRTKGLTTLKHPFSNF